VGSRQAIDFIIPNSFFTKHPIETNNSYYRVNQLDTFNIPARCNGSFDVSSCYKYALSSPGIGVILVFHI